MSGAGGMEGSAWQDTVEGQRARRASGDGLPEPRRAGC